MSKVFQKPAFSSKMPLSKHATPLALLACRPLPMIQVLKLMPARSPRRLFGRYAPAKMPPIKTIWKSCWKEMNGVPPVLRTARYWCVLVYMRHADDPTPIICQTSWEGSRHRQAVKMVLVMIRFLMFQSRLLPPNWNQSKNRLSHRGKALAQLAKSPAK